MNILGNLAAGIVLAPLSAIAAVPDPGKVTGSFTVNGQSVEFRHAYFYRQAEGFYDPEDPTWMVLLTAEPVAPGDIEDRSIDPSLRLGLTLTSEFGDSPALELLSQNMQVGSFTMTGGKSPQMDFEQQGPEVFAGRVHLAEPQTFFDDTYHYDLSFHALPVGPNVPTGDPLPEGGGEPGAAYIAWTRTIHGGDLEALRALVTPDLAAMLDGPDAAEQLEFLALMTPMDVRIVDGYIDGSTAVLSIEGTMDGEVVKGEITLEQFDGLWVPTGTSME